MEIKLTDIEETGLPDLNRIVSMRYRLATDPDIDANYTAVTDTETKYGITYPFFDIAALDTGTYVLHVYETAAGTATGTKQTIEVTSDVAL